MCQETDVRLRQRSAVADSEVTNNVLVSSFEWRELRERLEHPVSQVPEWPRIA
jgi:hypothetical protein